ncbi:MAG: DNA-directed RNA polymerase subunit alpha [Planctomycetota bacterium]|jgi:DNA-directed RNA polymerase subunit alpha
MRIRWRNFELPSKVVADKNSGSESNYGRFTIEPFERGFGHTIGNGLRRVLLSSIEGTAVTAVRIEGADHEFASIEGVYEDVTDIILNIKRLRIQYHGNDPIICRIEKEGKGPVTGDDVFCAGDAEVANKDLVICNLSLDRSLSIELEVSKGRGYIPAEENCSDDHPHGTIPVDSVYSPVHRVRYAIEATRVGKFTNYDRLVLELWTDGTITPELALTQAAKIYRKHLNPFVLFDPATGDLPMVGDPSESEFNQKNREDDELQKLLDRPISDLELSVRARNCLDSANLQIMRDLVSMSENEVMKLKNLGKTSLTEIKSRLTEKGLSLGMLSTANS